MSLEQKIVTLPGDSPGAETTLTWYRVGPEDAAVKVHLQAALHADEQPGTMVLHHLLPTLIEADAAGLLHARFSVMPMVNPLGMANMSLRNHIGRYDIGTGINYNRRWPDLFAAIRQNLSGRLTEDAAFNVMLVRRTVGQWIDAQEPVTAIEQLRLLVLRECHDADLVLDLHCDSDSLIHIYTSPELMPGLQDLSDWMGAAATLTASDSGGGSFDEVLPQLYRRVASVNPTKPLPMATATATLEYRGRADTFDILGADDARRLVGFFAGRGWIDADAGPRPNPAPGPTPFDATEIVRAPMPGLIAYQVDLGAEVKAGDLIADLVALDGPEAFLGRTPIVAGTDGFVLTRQLGKYVPRGAGIAKIVGANPLPSRKGYLLED